MKLSELKMGERFKLAGYEYCSVYTKLGEVPQSGGAKYYVENKNINTVYMCGADEEVIKMED